MYFSEHLYSSSLHILRIRHHFERRGRTSMEKTMDHVIGSIAIHSMGHGPHIAYGTITLAGESS